jgi:hypothetical protein
MMCSASSFGRILTSIDRETLLALSHMPSDYVSLEELVDQTEGSIAAGVMLLSLRELVNCGLVWASEIGWRWQITPAGRSLVQRLVAEAMNSKGADEGRQI